MTRTAGDLDPKILMQSVGRDELMAFARDGYLHLRGIIPQSSCDYLIERTWSKLPDHWVKNDPQSWCGDVQDSCHLADLNYRRGLVKFQKGELVEDQVIHKSFGAGSPLEQIALGLIPISPPLNVCGCDNSRPHTLRHTRLILLHFVI
ncbi:hypothetical protein ACU8OP_23400 [Rhizobium leguminosarum]